MVAADEDALIAPRRDELPHRIVELSASLLPQHHQPHAHDRLRHRIDAEDRMLGDWPLPLDLEVALRLEVRDFSPARDEREGAGELAGVDVTLEVIGDASEPRRRQSDFFGLHEHFILLFETTHATRGAACARSTMTRGQRTRTRRRRRRTAPRTRRRTDASHDSR